MTQYDYMRFPREDGSWEHGKMDRRDGAMGRPVVLVTVQVHNKLIETPICTDKPRMTLVVCNS